ncbi:hypothetical protein [Imhoffiella purpurea]|uniref:hypothetical protein n=1 Tax=Imhoffiella purpurea TaxID=1249627 RepID=UPI0012FE2C21|nr:hypothetical protein [Imhoffiella purpurea]
MDEYIDREKAFYNAMLSLYLERDGEKLKEMPVELTKVLAPWAHMTPSGMVHASEIGSLEEEKAALASELQSTKQTLEDLMEEYMAAFDKNQEAAQLPVEEDQLQEELAQEEMPEPEPEEAAEITFDEPAAASPEEEMPLEDETDPTAGIEFDAPGAETPKEVPPEEEMDVAAELGIDEPPASTPSDESTARQEQQKEREQIDPLEEPEDLDDVSLSALGIDPEPTPAIPEPETAEDIEPGNLEEDLFEMPDSPDQPEQPKQKNQTEETPPTEEDLEDARAREELEGLADLFDPPSDKP